MSPTTHRAHFPGRLAQVGATDLLALRSEVLADLMTVDEMADEIGVPARTVRGRAVRLGIGRVVGGVRVLLPEDALALVAPGTRGPRRSLVLRGAP